jgi:hypothetical protein
MASFNVDAVGWDQVQSGRTVTAAIPVRLAYSRRQSDSSALSALLTPEAECKRFECLYHMICVNTPSERFPTIPHFNVTYGVSRWLTSDRLADDTTRVPNSSKLASQRSSGLPKGQPSTPSASCCNKSPKVRGRFGLCTAVCTAYSLSHSGLVCAFQRFLIHGRGVSTKFFALFSQA